MVNLEVLGDLVFRVLSEPNRNHLETHGYIAPTDCNANITPEQHPNGRIRHPRLPSQYTSWSANYYATRYHAGKSWARVAVIERTPDMVDAHPFSQADHEFLVAGDITRDRIVALYGPNELNGFVMDMNRKFNRNCGHLSRQDHKGTRCRIPIFLRSECEDCNIYDEEHYMDCLSEDNMDRIPDHLLRQISNAW